MTAAGAFGNLPMNRITRHTLMALIAVALPGPLTSLRAADTHIPLMPRAEDYTLLWWADGPPHFLGSKVPPATETLCFQSGIWGLALDAKRVRVLRFGKWAASMGLEKAVQPGRAALAELPTVDWDCAVVAAGRKFTCVGHVETKDEFFQPVRFVESGWFFQRVVIEGLKFADRGAAEFPCAARLEISAWPDRLALRLELEPTDLPAGSRVEMRLADRRASTPLAAKTSVLLEAFGDGAAARPIVEADPALKVGVDEALGCQTLRLPEEPWSNAKGTYYPEEHLDRLDRWHLALRNDSDRAAVARLMFTQTKNLNLTGFTPMLCDADGAPTGLPVQISKDWHQRPEKGALLHQGPWFHGCAFVRLPPKSNRQLLFQMVHARYGGVFAASHAQLSLIGWGHNQFWDQAAIGSFGESICFEPGRVQRRCFIDDVRPLLAHGKSAKPWGWAENCGGGDFLMWQDAQERYQPMRATRTDYRAYGPCLTDAGYIEESCGGELAARMDVKVPRSDDHLRTFFHLRYDVRRPMQWRRLAFFQLGSDFYNDDPSRRVGIGDENGLHEEWEPQRANDVYDRIAVPMTGAQPWLSIHGLERETLRPGQAAASRGLIVRSWRAVLGGRPAMRPHASFFCTEWGKHNYRTVVELAPPPAIKDLLPGDFVEADLELVVFPATAAAYYGPDKVFQHALARDPDSWRLVQREAAGNDLKTQTRHGQVMSAYPLVVAVDTQQRAEITFHGGLGYVPATFTGLASPDGYGLFVDDQRLDQSVHGNDFWQTDYDPATQRWRQTFNNAITANQPHAIRLQRKAEVTGSSVLRATNAPQSVTDLWADFDPRQDPLETEVIREWKSDGMVLRSVRFLIGTFKGKSSRMAAFYGFPEGTKERLPAVMHIHGGGGRADLDEVKAMVARGYAALSVNWGGREMEDSHPGDANTDWGAVDPTQKNVSGYSSMLPGPKQFYEDREHPKNCNWYLLTLGCRRGLTFLERQPEVDPQRLGIHGWSMGGNLTMYVAGSDARVKAAVPGVGGQGWRWQPHPFLGGTVQQERIQGDVEVFRRTLSFESYAPLIRCPILHRSGTNDFHGWMDDVYRTDALIEGQPVRHAWAPHFNHRVTAEVAVAMPLWLDHFLKGGPALPETPASELILKTADGVPALRVAPRSSWPVARCDIYYSIDADPRDRFWRSAEASRDGDVFTAKLPLPALGASLFAFANVYYTLPIAESMSRLPQFRNTIIREVCLSTAFHGATPNELRAAATRFTDATSLLIDDFSHGWRDWYRLNEGNRDHWQNWTHKITDPKWRGPAGATLAITLKMAQSNRLGFVVVENQYRTYRGPRRILVCEKEIRGAAGAQTILLDPAEFRDAGDDSPLKSWRQLDLLGIGACLQEMNPHGKFKPLPGRRAQPVQWHGPPPEFIRLEWR